ncbi:universal stress protein [Salinicola halimionae]|uniref:universal stress protein n=1 Tax=Salinicola halimionae TaxID=1949081 RepID=UPI000DA1B67A|nr:universal stress protein [Salinicola halimionae]
MTQQILVPIDGSENARKALELACLIQRASGAKLHLLHVPEPPPATDSLGARLGASALDYTSTKGREHGEQLLREARLSVGDEVGDVAYLVVEGPPARVIVEQADRLGVDTIIMGSRGLSDLKGLLVGSVSHKVSHVASCPVITLHEPD